LSAGFWARPFFPPEAGLGVLALARLGTSRISFGGSFDVAGFACCAQRTQRVEADVVESTGYGEVAMDLFRGEAVGVAMMLGLGLRSITGQARAALPGIPPPTQGTPRDVGAVLGLQPVGALGAGLSYRLGDRYDVFARAGVQISPESRIELSTTDTLNPGPIQGWLDVGAGFEVF
jgi:hypothetical protein